MKNKGDTMKMSRFQFVNILRSDFSFKVKMQLLWRRSRQGFANMPVYFLLIAMSFVFLLPFFYMICRSFMTQQDIANQTLVKWLPRSFSDFSNYDLAIMSLKYWENLWTSVWTTALAVSGQLLTCTFVAYGLARMKFKGSGFIFALVIFTLIIPPQVTIGPTFVMFSRNSPFGTFFDWRDTFFPIIVPCFFAMGLSGGLFVFIYRQYFRSMPSELENAALIDGCGVFGSYFRIILPNAKSPMLVCLILSIVWQWNNSFEPGIFIINKNEFGNLPMQLELMANNAGSAMQQRITGATDMAATFLVILPIIIVFFLLQNQFMKGIERVGLAN